MRDWIRSLRLKLDVGAGGLVVLDAAVPTARAPDGAVAKLPLEPGSYALSEAAFEADGGPVRVLRLTRASSAARKRRGSRP